MVRSVIVASAVLTLVSAVHAQGVTADQLVLGQVCALKGQAAGLGTGMQTGLQVYFDMVNGKGGVNGRKILLNSLNDGYEPERCVQAVKLLIEKENVFALIGGVGTPTSKEAIPVCTQAKVPYIAAFTGAELLRTPYNRYVVNLRASYFQETERLAALLVDEKGLKRVACFYQDDAYGQAGLAGIKKALERRGLQLCGEGNYKRNTLAIGGGLDAVAGSKPDAVVLVGAYAPCAEFGKQARQNEALKTTTLCNISFVGTDNLVQAAGPAGENTIISQVVPYPWDASVPVVAEYQAEMKKAGKEKEIGFITLEGFLAAKLFCTVLAKVPGTPTREAFLDEVAKTTSLDLGGLQLGFGPNDNQGSDAVFLTQVQGGKPVPVLQAVAAPAK